MNIKAVELHIRDTKWIWQICVLLWSTCSCCWLILSLKFKECPC